jgi:hypothetical protein
VVITDKMPQRVAILERAPAGHILNVLRVEALIGKKEKTRKAAIDALVIIGNSCVKAYGLSAVKCRLEHIRKEGGKKERKAARDGLAKLKRR